MGGDDFERRCQAQNAAADDRQVILGSHARVRYKCSSWRELASVKRFTCSGLACSEKALNALLRGPRPPQKSDPKTMLRSPILAIKNAKVGASELAQSIKKCSRNISEYF